MRSPTPGLVAVVACALGACADGRQSNPSGSGATGTQPRAPSATNAGPVDPRPAVVGEWLQLTDDFATEGCDLVNGADFEAIVRLDRRLERVSELRRDVPDEFTDLWLDEDFNVLSEPAGTPVGRVRFGQDLEGTRRPWLLRPDGSAWSLDEGAERTSPLQYRGVPCEACPFVDDVMSRECKASVAVRIPDGAAYPEGRLRPRVEAGDPVVTDAGVAPLLPTREISGPSISIGDAAPTPLTSELVEWRSFGRGRDTCDAINGADFVAVSGGSRVVVVGQRPVDEPDRLIDGELQFKPAVRGSVPLPFAGSWHLVSAADGATLADLVFTTDADGGRALWLAAPDGSAWALGPANAGTPPSRFSNAPCDACELIDQLAPGACD